MFPIRDHNPSGSTPYVTWALMVANILVFLSYAGSLSDIQYINAIYENWAMLPKEIAAGKASHTLFSSMFLHAGWMHLAGNMLFLYIFGDNIEDEMGHFSYLIFYISCGLAASMLQVLADPTSPIPTVGASGAIAGVMGGYLLMFPKARVDILLILVIFFRVFPIPAWIMLVLWFAMQFVGVLGSDTQQGGVAYWAHAGGFIAGLLLTVPLWLRSGAMRFWSTHHGAPPHPEAQYAQSRIPKVRQK
ncbi:MAG: rhomboid family intramembrane serine protease [Paracoccaceae bacterium]